MMLPTNVIMSGVKPFTPLVTFHVGNKKIKFCFILYKYIKRSCTRNSGIFVDFSFHHVDFRLLTGKSVGPMGKK